MAKIDLKMMQADEFTMHRLSKAIKHNNQIGGTMEITYQGIIKILAPKRDVLQALEAFQDEKERFKIMNSVMKSLKAGKKKMLRNQLTQKEAIEMAQDIAIWYANEIVEGRAKEPELFR